MSTLAALQLVSPAGLKILAKLSGRVLNIAVQSAGVIKLFRSIELSETTPGEVVSHLFPTFAYVEDELGARPDILFLCGFDRFGDRVHDFFQSAGRVQRRLAGLPGIHRGAVIRR